MTHSRTRSVVAFVALAVIAALTVAACQTVPYTGRKQAVAIPDSQLEDLGASAFDELLQEDPPMTGGPLVNQVRTVSTHVVKETPPDFASLDWQVEVLDSDSINAFALPGGKIGLYRGILPVLANEAGLASVVGHEVGHVIGRHSGERVTRAMVVQLGLTAADIGLSNSAIHDELMSLLGLGAVVGVELPYSRANESEADELGGIMMAKAGYDPAESIAVWERMSAARGSGGPPEILSTHPSNSTRIARLQTLLPTFDKYYRVAPVQRGKGEALQLGATSPVNTNARASSTPAPTKTTSAKSTSKTKSTSKSRARARQ